MADRSEGDAVNMADRSDSLLQAANEYFDALVKSRFIEMFGDLNQETSWELCKLSELFDLIMGKTPSRDEPRYWSVGVHPWVSISDITSSNGVISDTREKISDDAVSESGIKQIDSDTVLMSFKLSIGKTALTKFPLYTNEAIVAFIPKKTGIVNNTFLQEWIREKDWSEGSNKAVKGVTLNKATLKEIRIPIPPIELQNQFADFVRQVDKSKLLFQQLVSKYDQLVKSRFIEMFGNINAKLKLSVLGFCRNGLNYSKSGGEYSIKCISVRDFQNNLSTKQIEDVETISIDHPVDGPFLENGDILFVRSNGNKSLVGRSLLVEGLSELTSYSGFCISYRLYDDNILLPDFLIHYLHMDSSRQLLFKNAQVDKSKSEILEGIKRLNLPQIN